MIFIKIPSTEYTNDGYTNVLHELGIESEPNTYQYLNITGFSVAPYRDKAGNIDEFKSVLLNPEGQAVVTIPKRPADLVNMLGQCIMEVG